MSGRKDFAIIRSEALGNEKIDAFADALIADGLADESTALPAALGVVAMLGLWAYRETDDGVMSITEIRRAILSRGRLLNVLRTSQLLREQSDGRYYLVGFEDCYGSYVKARKEARERMRDYRASKRDAGSENVRRTLPERSTTQYKTGQDTTCPVPVGTGSAGARDPALGGDAASAQSSSWRAIYGTSKAGIVQAARDIGALLKREPIGADHNAGPALLDVARNPKADQFTEALARRLDNVERYDATLAERAQARR